MDFFSYIINFNLIFTDFFRQNCRDPRWKRMKQKEEEERKTSTSNRDGAKLSFQEKMELFAAQNGGAASKAKISKAQREIDDSKRKNSTEDEEYAE